MLYKKDIVTMPKYFDRYIGHVNDEIDLINGLKSEIFCNDQLNKLIEIPDFAYQEGKWTVKQCLQHISDTERVFQYRALRISRNDATPLPGYDQDQYAIIADVSNRSVKSLIDEIKAVRLSTIYLFESLNLEELARVGTCSNNDISVIALGFTIIGHQLHHEQIFGERYLTN